VYCIETACITFLTVYKRLYRLPTEAEWEYACREEGHALTAFYFGDSLSSTQANFVGNYPYGGAPKGPYFQRTTPVDKYKPNKLGLYDMHGNLLQWCQDWYDKDFYRKSPAADPVNNEMASIRVVRGGCWDTDAGNCRSANRKPPLGARGNNLGFRVAAVQSGG
jgi:formylglycine-generating enzyme required for sulfatase activity